MDWEYSKVILETAFKVLSDTEPKNNSSREPHDSVAGCLSSRGGSCRDSELIYGFIEYGNEKAKNTLLRRQSNV